jgi:hypothetical protein
VGALDLGEVERPGVAAEQQPARESLLRQTVEPALGDRPRTIAQALAAFEILPDPGLQLEALKLFEGRKVGIGIIEISDQTNRHLAVLEMIEKRTPGCAMLAEWPTRPVDHQARPVLRRIDLPEFLDPETIVLGSRARGQIVARDQFFAELATRAFGKQRVLGVQLQTRLETVFRLAVLVTAHVAGSDALDRTVVVVEDFGRGKAREDFDTDRFGLLGEPAAKAAQADDVIARIVHRRGNGEIGQLDRRGLAAIEINLVLADRGLQWRSPRLPVGQQLVQRARLEQRTREDVSADFRALLQYHDRQVGIQLFQANGRAQTRRTPTDNHYVILHRFPFHHRSSRFLN